MADLTTTLDNDAVGALTALDSNGNVLAISGVPTWGVDSPDVADMTVAADGLSAVFVTKAVGTITITASADVSFAGKTVNRTVSRVLSVEAGVTISLDLALTSRPK